MNSLQLWLNDIPEYARQHPFLMLTLVVAPLVLLAWRRKTFPHVPLVVLMLLPCALTFLLLIRADITPLVLAIDLIVVVLATLDYFTLPTAKAFSAERQSMKIASLNKAHPVVVTLVNHSGNSYFVWVRDDVPQEFNAEPEEFAVAVGPRSRTTLKYELRAKRRGAFSMNTVYVRVRSKFGLWKRFFKYAAASELSVYPDMKQLSKYAILARTNRLSLMGVRRTRRVGQDNEFERLRDYTPDDNYKHIEWRTTARRNKLTVKDFQTSQSQRIIFLLDCGRMMTNEASGLSLLDHSLNAMLMLSYVALRQGDSVGMICFSDQVHAYVPPKGGMDQMNNLLHASFDRFPRMVESRYDQAFLYLGTHCQKRSLVVLMTNVIDEVNSMQVESYLASAVGKHLPLGVLIRDHRLFEAADNPPRDEAELYRAAAAADILTWRHQVLTDMEHQGVRVLDVFPEDMTAPLVNKYLEIKARHLL
ncbi:MAG TPA: DUF58 domain-containing protein [Pirellulaceae bacterium]|nr:DUF58 domain-containing protein [Pirellulaceae bacterium]